MTIDISSSDLQTVKNILKKYLSQYPVWAFGSRVNGNAKPFSDLDIVVINDEPLNIELYTKLKQAFSDSDIPFLVDIVDWYSTSANFKAIIQQRYEIIQS